jgi:hypothetical protein
MKNNITLHLDHSNTSQVENFLNFVGERLVQIPFDAQDWRRTDDIIAGFKFKGVDHAITITIIFATSYFHANEIGTVNSLNKIPNTNWTVNGGVLYVVESKDEHALSEMLSLFAGRE